MFSLEGFVNAAVAIIFLVYWGAVFVVFYHLTRFGVGTLPKKLSAIFLLGSVFLFSISIILHFNLDLNAMNI